MAIPPIIITVEDTLTAALHRLMNSRESWTGLSKAVNQAMQYWVSFIMKKQTVASKPGIRAYLMQPGRRSEGRAPVRRVNKRGKESTASRYLALRNSRAAAIVWSTNYQGAKSLEPKAFFGLVGRYIGRRQYSAGYHKAGFRPALAAFKIARGNLGQAPNYQKEVSTAFTAHNVSDSIIEAMVINAAAGVSLNPTGGDAAVEASKNEVIAILTKWTEENILQRAAGLGFRGR